MALVWSSVIHLQLWSDGYRTIPVIGPLFLIQGIVGIALALVLATFRWAVLLAAGAALLAGTAVGLLLSAGIGLFGYQESLAVPYAASSLTVEFAGAAVLAAAVTIVLAGRLWPWLARSRPSSGAVLLGVDLPRSRPRPIHFRMPAVVQCGHSGNLS